MSEPNSMVPSGSSDDLPGISRPEAECKPIGSSSSVRQRAVSGTLWTLGAFGIGILLRFGTNLLLAHLLFPAAFALMSLAAVLAQGLKMFSDIGIGLSIVRSERGNDPAFLNTAWTIQIIRGVILFLFACLAAWPMAKIYDDDRLLWVVPVSSLSLIIGGFGATSQFTLNRELRLGRLTLLNLFERVVQTVITAGWAILNPTVWAILIGMLFSRVVYVAGTHTWLGHGRNRFAWDRSAVRELVRFGKWVFVSTAITFFATQIDRMILGRMTSLEVLGVYSVALTLAGIPQEIGTRLTESVLFAALSSVARTNRDGLHERLLRARSVLLSGLLVATLGVILAGPWFFRYLYDARYAAAEWMAPIAAGCVWIALLQATADRALLSLGNSRALAVSGALNLIATIVFCTVGYSLFDVPGFVAGVGVGNAVGLLVVQVALSRNGLPIHVQDFKYSALLVGLVVLNYLMIRLIGQRWPTVPDWMTAGIVGLPILAVVGLWAALRVNHQLKSR